MTIKKAECVYCERIMGGYGKILVTESVFADIRIAKVIQSVNIRKRQVEKDNKRIAKVLKKCCDINTILIGNELIVKELELFNQSFFVRKKEMLNHIQEILWCFPDKQEMTKSRKTFLLVMGSDGWNQKEIVKVLEVAKDYYEDIYIVVKNVRLNMDQLVDYFHVEYGIVIHIATEREAKAMQVDFGLFLVGHWCGSFKRYYFRKGYVVAEWEEDMKRRRVNVGKMTEQNQHLINRELYSGFVYENEKKQLPYEIGVMLANNQSIQESFQKEKKENPISIVAIYGVE